MHKPAPAVLAARGLKTISENLPKGKGVNFAADFTLIFQQEIRDRFLRPASGHSPVCRADSSSSDSK
jgi:hypothetical protein